MVRGWSQGILFCAPWLGEDSLEGASESTERSCSWCKCSLKSCRLLICLPPKRGTFYRKETWAIRSPIETPWFLYLITSDTYSLHICANMYTAYKSNDRKQSPPSCDWLDSSSISHLFIFHLIWCLSVLDRDLKPIQGRLSDHMEEASGYTVDVLPRSKPEFDLINIFSASVVSFFYLATGSICNSKHAISFWYTTQTYYMLNRSDK